MKSIIFSVFRRKLALEKIQLYETTPKKLLPLQDPSLRNIPSIPHFLYKKTMVCFMLSARIQTILQVVFIKFNIRFKPMSKDSFLPYQLNLPCPVIQCLSTSNLILASFPWKLGYYFCIVLKLIIQGFFFDSPPAKNLICIFFGMLTNFQQKTTFNLPFLPIPATPTKPPSSPNNPPCSSHYTPFFSDAAFKDYNNSIEEMKNLSKMARDHKRLVLGSTGKSFGENRDKENIDFQNLIRSRSFNPQATADPTNDPRSRQSLGSKIGLMLSEHRKSLEKTRENDPRIQPKHLTSFHVHKREKLTLNSSDNTPPHGPKCKEAVKRKAPHPLFQPSGSNPFEGVSMEILAHLLDGGILSISSEGTYTVRKEHLMELLSNILLWLLKGEAQEGRSKCTSIYLNKLMSKLVLKMDKEVLQSRKKKLSKDNRTLSMSVIDQTDALAKLCLNKIGKLTQEGHKLQQQVQKLVRYEQNIKSQCKYSQAMIQKQKRQLEQLQQCSHREQEQLHRLQAQVKNVQIHLMQLVESQNKVKNFILEQQSNKIVKEVLLEYKQIQADIYEYAAYLQSNQLASDLFYEPHPFRAVQVQIQEELKKVNTAILQGKSPLEEKAIMMRDFVLDSMGKFKRKDEQMTKLIQFRTKCIHNFIQHMKRWLNNWEFKQEFLVNLRKEFAYDSCLLIEIFEKGKDNPVDDEAFGRMKELTNKIIQNYELGNSFY